MSEPSRFPTPPAGAGAPNLWRYYSAVLGFGVILFLLVIPVAQGGQGGGSLLGSISDADNGAVDGMLVILRSETYLRVTRTGEGGRFEFLDLDPGKYTLEATGTGYQDTHEANVHVRRGRSTTLRMKVAAASRVRIVPEASQRILPFTGATEVTGRP